MPHQGSYPEKALQKAVELFRQASVVNGHVLMVTDGIDSPGISGAVNKLTDAGYSLSILGIGTEEGAPIANRSGGFVKDQRGSIVLSRLDAQKLQDVARQGNGVFRKMSANDSDINHLLQVVSPSKMQEEFSVQKEKLNLSADQWREEGPWILILLLPLIALIFRRGYLVILLAVILPFPHGAYAFEWSSLWKNQDQQAASALEQGDSKSAAEMFSDPEWKAAASYRAGDYQKAIESLQDIQNPDAIYNRGNALARTGDIQQAIQAYEEALKLDPQHKDAKYNRDLLQEYLEKQQQQQQQDNNQSQNNEDNRDNKNSQDSESGQQSEDQKNSGGQQDNQSACDQNLHRREKYRHW